MDRARPAASSSAPASAPASTAAWAARVAAWHNRHPLAARITPVQVQDLGYVDLPFSAREAATRRHWRAVFSDNFLPPFKPAQIARWALRHGLEQMPRDAGQPVRQVPIDRRQLPPEGLALVLWVGTAAIHDAQGERTRVLLAPQAPHAVLGQRLWSLQRVAVAALAGLLLVTRAAAAAAAHGGAGRRRRRGDRGRSGVGCAAARHDPGRGRRAGAASAAPHRWQSPRRPPPPWRRSVPTTWCRPSPPPGRRHL